MIFVHGWTGRAAQMAPLAVRVAALGYRSVAIEVWETLMTGCSYADAGSDLLLIYDETDRFVDHGEGDTIRALCPGARLLKTSGHGHQRILVAPELAQAVGEFLGKDVST